MNDKLLFVNGFNWKITGTLIFCLLYIQINLNGQISVTFSQERGFYDSSFSVELTCPEDSTVTIRYTTNNSKPSPTQGTIYTGPIPVNGTESIRAIAYGTSGTSEVATHTYLFLNSIASAGYMYSYIKNDPVYGPLLRPALEAIPSISLVSNQISEGTDLNETEISAELLFPNGKEGFMVNCGVETWGGSPTNPKKSYRLEFKKAYGPGKLEYDLFAADEYEDHQYNITPTRSFDKLLLRAGSQDGLNGEFGNETRAQFLRNRFIMDASIELGYHAPHGRYVHVYINGGYAGQYHLMERPDGGFFESYFGDDKDNYEVRREETEYWNGNGSVYEALAANIDLSSVSAMANTEKYIDLKSAANYLVLMSYLSGFDWDIDHNSLCGGHEDLDVVPYKFLVWDADLALGNGGKWDPGKSGDVTYFEAPVDEYGPVPTGLVGHTEFDLMMADALQCACFDDGILTTSNAVSLYSHRASQIDTSLIAESARWGDLHFTSEDNVNVDEWEVFADWNVELNRMLTTYLPQRRLELIDHFKDLNIYPSIDPVALSQNGGIVPTNFYLTLTNLEGTGTIFYTMDGSDPRNHGGGINPNASIYFSGINLPDGVYDFKARVRKSGNWSAMCPKRFYVGQDYDKVVINEIHYHPQDSVTPTNDTIDGKEFEFVELKNTGTSDVFLTDLEFVKGIRWAFPEGSNLAAGNFMILAEDAENFEAKYGISSDYIYEGKLDNGGEKLQLLKPDKNVLDEVKYNDKLPWNPIPDSSDYSLALIDPNYDNDSPVNWSTQSIPVTPGVENLFDSSAVPDYTNLVINEIHYYPGDSLVAGDGEKFEFIELKNKGPEPISLADVEFTQGVFFKFNDTVVIPPYSFITIAKDSSWYLNKFGSYPIAEYQDALDNTGDTLLIKSLFNDTIDLVAYDDIAPWPGTMQDSSIGLIQESLDNYQGSNWSLQNKTNTAGMTNTFNCIITLNELNMPLLDTRTVKADQQISTNGFVPAQETVSYQSALSIDLQNHFEVKLGAIFEAKIGGCN